MRIIKLSKNKPHGFETREKVDEFFDLDLRKKRMPGQFLVPKGWIREGGIEQDETLIFTYDRECVYKAHAKSGREKYNGPENDYYRYYCDSDSREGIAKTP
jgi:hypothetical protein